ncbi:MAG: hypothetical protein PHX83_01025 [Acidobacteriia bacterium]|nr:hypothetical protein [Terriglobia bacterium]
MNRTIALVGDLFFATRIEDAAKQLGIPLQLVSSEQSLYSELKAGNVGSVIVDLNFDSQNAARIISKAKSLSNARILGFLSHVQEELATAARHAGADAVVPRSFFAKNLGAILQGSIWDKLKETHEASD